MRHTINVEIVIDRTVNSVEERHKALDTALTLLRTKIADQLLPNLGNTYARSSNATEQLVHPEMGGLIVITIDATESAII